MTPVPERELSGAMVPAWVVNSARERWDGWHRRRPDQAPGPGLVFQWALDAAGLRPAYRLTVEVVLRLGAGTPSAMQRIAERVGVNDAHLRQRVVPALEAIGFLVVERPPRCSHRPPIWTATVPAIRPTPEATLAKHRAAFACGQADSSSRTVRALIARDAR